MLRILLDNYFKIILGNSVKAPSPFIDPNKINFLHLNQVKTFIWEVPLDFDPSDIRDYKSAYTSVFEFLLSKGSSGSTIKTYTTELEKFLQWTLRVRKVHPFKIKAYDIEEFMAFCRKPYSSWVGTGSYKRYKIVDGEELPNPKWRPFTSIKGNPPSQVSLRKTLASISSYYVYIAKLDYISKNPVLAVDSKQHSPPTKQNTEISRVLSEQETELLEKTLDLLVEEDQKYNRERFIIVAMIHMFLRVSDLAPYRGVVPQMCDFHYHKFKGWRLRVYGKGNKERSIPANSAVMSALISYRQFLGLSDYPPVMDEEPLIHSVKGGRPIKSTNQISSLIKNIFGIAKEAAVKKGFEPWEIGALDKASSHWLRHTGITAAVKVRSLSHVSEDAGHSTIAMTGHYITNDDIERHLSSELQVKKRKH